MLCGYKIMRVVYEETDGCRDCLYNKCGMCYKLSRPLKELCFDMDCPLPTKEIVEGFTRYITSDKSLNACGNCRHWTRWVYNNNLETEVGTCNKEDILLFTNCTSTACDDFKEV